MIGGLRRSALYVPGDSDRMLRGSIATGADVLLLNLEDGVAAARKTEARENVARVLRELEFPQNEAVVRVNPLESETGRLDLAAVVQCRPDGICLPKVESAAQVRDAEATILRIEREKGITPGGIKLHAMIESAAGVLQAPGIAAACARMASLIFGAADYAADTGCEPGEDRQELSFALQMIATAARAAGIEALDAPCFEIRNVDLLRREAVQARRIGFSGKCALHPLQIGPLHEVFTVTSEEVAWAEQVLRELDRAEAGGRALSTMEGRLIDNPHRLAAERILSRSARARIPRTRS